VVVRVAVLLSLWAELVVYPTGSGHAGYKLKCELRLTDSINATGECLFDRLYIPDKCCRSDTLQCANPRANRGW